MTLRKTFFDVGGFPNCSGEPFREYLDQYAPMDGSGEPFVFEPEAGAHWYSAGRMQIAKLNYIAEQYPNMPVQDAELLFEQQTKLSGDLKFRTMAQTEITSTGVAKACQEFRHSCGWWQNGDRFTHAMWQDAQEFESVASKWLRDKDIAYYEDETGTNIVKREVELSIQFANTVSKAIEETKSDLGGADHLRTIRTQAFQSNLDQVFTSYDV